MPTLIVDHIPGEGIIIFKPIPNIFKQVTGRTGKDLIKKMINDSRGYGEDKKKATNFQPGNGSHQELK
jgi:hypothetical protein